MNNCYEISFHDGLLLIAAESSSFVSTASAVSTILENGGVSDPFLGGQDYYREFAISAATANGSLITEFDESIESLWNTYVTIPYKTGEKDFETCLAEFRSAVSNVYPDFTVDDLPKILSLTMSSGTYQEEFTDGDTDRYFVLDLNSEAQLSLIGTSIAESSGIEYEVSGGTIQVQDDIIYPITSGISTITARVIRNGETDDSSAITGKVLVVDRKKTVRVPDSVTWLETEAFREINAECIILSADIWVIEGNCFANCPNLSTVIWIGDPSGMRVASPFSSVNSILFLSRNGQLPMGLNTTNHGVTYFTGF